MIVYNNDLMSIKFFFKKSKLPYLKRKGIIGSNFKDLSENVMVKRLSVEKTILLHIYRHLESMASSLLSNKLIKRQGDLI